MSFSEVLWAYLNVTKKQVSFTKLLNLTIHELFGLLFPDFAVKLMIDEQSTSISSQQH